MNLSRLLRVGGIALLAFAVAIGLSFEVDAQQTTGKVAGRVTDAATGEALPGVNVVLVGTNRGATTNVNGEYFIILVTPGRYNVQASFIGYQSVVKTDVAVQIDLTSTVDFQLRESAQQLDDLVVTAERPPVQMDVSYSQMSLDAGEIADAPVGSRLRDAFATQAGMDSDDWGLTVRGSNEEELVYNLDGVGQRDNRHSRPHSSFSQTALQEVQILTGGFNAEYDHVRSGVINVVSKEPRQWTIAGDARYEPAHTKNFKAAIFSQDNWWDIGRFQNMTSTADVNGDGEIDFPGWNQEFVSRGGPNGDWVAGINQDPITTPEQAKAVWDWQHRAIPDNDQQNLNTEDRDADYTYDLTVGGPLVQDKISFLLSNRKESTAYTWGMSVPNYRDMTTQARLIFTPTATTKLNIGFIRGWAQGGKYGDFLGTFARGARAEASNHRDRNNFVMGSGSNNETITRRHGTLTWTHTLSPKTFYNLTARFGKTNWLATWQPFQNAGVAAAAILPDGTIQNLRGGTNSVDKHGRIVETGYNRDAVPDATTLSSLRAQGAIIMDEAPLGFTYRPSSRDILGIYQVRGGNGNPARAGDWSFMYDTDVTLDMTSQITPNHQVKAGFQLHHFWLREIRGFVSTIQDPELRDRNHVPEGGWDDPANLQVTDTANFHNYWVRKPLYGGFFVQDRMEYRQIVVNAGVRLDYHRPDKFFDIPNEQHAAWMGNDAVTLYSKTRAVQPPTKWNFSPRLGVSHPITVDSKLYFNYGRFAQVPTSDQLYETQSGLGEPLETFGNPWISMPVTTAYELGYERNFKQDYLVAGTVYFKDIEKEIQRRARFAPVTRTNTGPRTNLNAFVKDQRGFELTVRKARGQFLTGYASYDFRVDRTRQVGWEFLNDVHTTSTPSRRRIEASVSAANPRFKARPIAKFGVNVRTPLDYGAEQSLLKGGWEANLFFRNEAGAWFNYNPGNDPALRDVDNAQFEDERSLDLRISKTFDVVGTPMVYFEVQNIFDSRFANTSSDGTADRVWNYPGFSRNDLFEAYMEQLGWRLDANGNLTEGDKAGKDLGPLYNPIRDYMFWFGKRSFQFGLRFSY